MQITRRLMLASAAAAALVPQVAEAAPPFGLDVVRNAFSLGLPEAEIAAPTGLAARPGGVLLTSTGDGGLSGQAYGLDGAPVGDRFKIFGEGVQRADLSGAFPDPVCFDDGSTLIVFAGRVKGESGPGVFARRLSADGRKGAFVRLSGERDDPENAVVARFGNAGAIVAWRSKVKSPDGTAKLRWRVVEANGQPRGAIRTLLAPDGVGYQEPRSIVSLKGGGAALDFVRAADAATTGDHVAQLISPEGEAVGRPAGLGPLESTPELVGLADGRLAALLRRSEGDLALKVFAADGRASAPVVVRTGLTGIANVVAAKPLGPGVAADGLALLVAGGEDSRQVVSLLLVDAAGKRLAKPAQIYRGEKTVFVPAGRRTEARHLAVLENGDLLAVHYAKASMTDMTPPLASLIRIGGA